MSQFRNYIGFDIGASNGRGVLGRFNGDVLSLDLLSRFDNTIVRVNNHLYWDILALWQSVKNCLTNLESGIKNQIASIGIDTWAVDFGLLDLNGDLLANPFSYRDPHTSGMMDNVFKIVPRDEIFDITGVQFMNLNTLYQLRAISLAGSPALQSAGTFLMIPDLFHYWLTGRKACEYTNASTTQLLNARTRHWDYPLIKRLGIPPQMFPEIIEPGQVLGNLSRIIREETGLPETPVVAVGTHDTASAVAGTPARSQNFAYISSGTWALMGVEIPEPILQEKVHQNNFGNEGGVFRTIRLLRNIANMWLLQECRRIWCIQGENLNWSEMSALASSASPFLATIDPDDPRFLLPENMPKAIQDYCRETKQHVPSSKGEIIRTVEESLAFKYRYNVEKLTGILGEKPSVMHITGGGGQNQMLNQFTANALNIPVFAGPVEATILGNIIVQMITLGDLNNLAEGRELISHSFPTPLFTPQETPEWENRYGQFLEKTKLNQEFG